MAQGFSLMPWWEGDHRTYTQKKVGASSLGWLCLFKSNLALFCSAPKSLVTLGYFYADPQPPNPGSAQALPHELPASGHTVPARP